MREISVWNADGRDISSAMFIAEGENIQRTAKNVIQGGNLSPDLVCTNKNLLALLKADVSSAEKSFPFPRWRKARSLAGVNPYTAAPASSSQNIIKNHSLRGITAAGKISGKEEPLAGGCGLGRVGNIAEADIGASESPRVEQKAWRQICN